MALTRYQTFRAVCPSLTGSGRAKINHMFLSSFSQIPLRDPLSSSSRSASVGDVVKVDMENGESYHSKIVEITGPSVYWHPLFITVEHDGQQIRHFQHKVSYARPNFSQV